MKHVVVIGTRADSSIPAPGVLNALPKSVQSKAKAALHDIWQAATREDAERAFEHFVATYEAKYPKATNCLAKDRDALMTFYDFPAVHWQRNGPRNLDSALSEIFHGFQAANSGVTCS